VPFLRRLWAGGFVVKIGAFGGNDWMAGLVVWLLVEVHAAVVAFGLVGRLVGWLVAARLSAFSMLTGSMVLCLWRFRGKGMYRTRTYVRHRRPSSSSRLVCLHSNLQGSLSLVSSDWSGPISTTTDYLLTSKLHRQSLESSFISCPVDCLLRRTLPPTMVTNHPSTCMQEYAHLH